MKGTDFSLKARRTSRIALRIPVILSPLDSGESKEFNGWTLVINQNGARLECQHGFEEGQEVEVKVLSTGKSARGKVVWSASQPDSSGTVELGVEVYQAQNLWGVGFPPDDWEAEKALRERNVAEHAGAMEQAESGPAESGPAHEEKAPFGDQPPVEKTIAEAEINSFRLSNQRLPNALKDVVEAILDGSGREISLRIEQMEKRLERVAERAQTVLDDMNQQLEQCSASIVAETTERLRFQMAELATGVHDAFMRQCISEIEKKQREAVEQVLEQSAMLAEQSVLDARAALARSLQEIAEAVGRQRETASAAA